MYAFTIVFEFKGGTYVSQHHAPNFEQAYLSWIMGLEVENVLGRDTTRFAKAALKDDELTPLDGMSHVRQGCISYGKSLYFPTFVLTMSP